MAIQDKFLTQYKKLNNEQKQAVDAIEGPVMVIAGPGTGKTQILTLRIANILRQTDTPPSAILAITFTESGVRSMRKRLVDFLGSRAYAVSIYTFHSFANDLIKRYPEEFPRIIGSASISEIDQIRIVEKIVLQNSWEHLKPFGRPHFYVRDIVGAIKNLKRENVTPKMFKELLSKSTEAEDKQLAKNRELAEVFELYEKELREKFLYDYEDMILEVVRTLEKSKDFLLRLEEQYHYILADEHQDANQSQNRLLELLSSFHDNPNLFIVGDEKQAIFRFQGASLDNFLYFKKKYPSALLVRLIENYRSTQTILDAAHSLIIKGAAPDPSLRVELKSQKGKGALIRTVTLADDETEALFVAKDIQEKIKKGVHPGTIAILYRRNKDAEDFVKIFEREKVPFSIESSEALFSDPDIGKLIMILRAIGNLRDDSMLGKVLFVDLLGVESLDAYTLLGESYKTRTRLSDLLSNTSALSKLSLKKPDVVRSLMGRLEKWARESHNLNLTHFFEKLLKDVGFIRELLRGGQSMDKLAKLDALLSEMRTLVESDRNRRLSDFLEYLDTLERYNILIETSTTQPFEESVRLMTAHKSKGMEFEYVYVVKVYDGNWGNRRARRTFNLPLPNMETMEDPGEDERRLFYVALTRAKSESVVTYGRASESGDERLPSQFVEEIDKEHVEISVQEQSNRFDNLRALGKKEKKSKVDTLDKKYLRELFLEQGLSVTALNNYLECPWRYFFQNLVRLPQVQSPHQLYGTAMHGALRELFDRLRDGDLPAPCSSRQAGKVAEKSLLDSYERNLKREPLSEGELAQALVRGKKALSGYFKEFHTSWEYPSLAEYNIAGVFLDVPSKDGTEKLLLKGKIDRIDVLPEKVRVIDYKTGSHKSRNEIEGKTKTGNGNLKRQLVFYRLLLDLHDPTKFPFGVGEIHFIEPNERGKYRSEAFEVSDAEIAELKETIMRTAKDILNFNFWKKICEKKDCEFCALGQFVKK